MTTPIKTKRNREEKTLRTQTEPLIRCSKCSRSKKRKEFTYICRSCKTHKGINKQTYYVRTREATYIIIAYTPQEVKDLLPFKVYNREIHLIKTFERIENGIR